MTVRPARGARLIDAATGAQLGGASLGAALDAVARALDPVPPGVVVCRMRNDLPSVVRYLGALRAGRPVLVWGPEPLDDLVRRFTPAVVLGADPGSAPPAGYAALGADVPGPAWVRPGPPDVLPHPDLALLLGTSGSTGRPRLVRMSASGLAAGLAAIRASLPIEPRDVAMTTLPLFFTYGLSVLNSHLVAGATVVLQTRGVLDDGCWLDVDRHRVSALAGVPHTYEVLARKPWAPGRNPTVRTLTAAGGRLRDELAARYHRLMADHGGALYVMYGQTEAGPRICVLPPERLPDKLGSVGPPVPGLRLTVEPDDAGAPGTGEVVCHGPSVMMGYAENAEDLARGDELGGTLRTGDRGRLDADGYLWLEGRLGRIGKVFGVRVNLDAVEHLVADLAVAAAVPAGDRIQVWCEGADAERLAAVRAAVIGGLGVHRLGVAVEAVDRLPRRPNGKVDYRALAG